jgi:hypothetical protein
MEGQEDTEPHDEMERIEDENFEALLKNYDM